MRNKFLALAVAALVGVSSLHSLELQAKTPAGVRVVYYSMETGRYYDANYRPLKKFKPSKHTKVRKVASIKPLRQKAHIRKAQAKNAHKSPKKVYKDGAQYAPHP